MEKEINGIKLEICANSIYSAEQAQAAGASRVELCQNLENGGTTPSYGQIKTTRDLLHIGVHVLIRPRAGDFLYNDQEYEEIKTDIQLCKELKCDGVVIGILDAAGQVDVSRMKELVKLAKPMTVVFHRAFDRCADPYKALEDIISLGCDRILTSGQKNTAEEGRALLRDLVELANGRIEIMPGSGVHAQNVMDILKYTQARSIHASAKTSVASEMLYHNDNLKGMDEDVIFSDRRKVEEIIEQIKSL